MTEARCGSPGERRVTAPAIVAELAAMLVGVAGCAIEGEPKIGAI